jgi:hypothetical protein
LALEFLAPIAALLVELGAWVRFPAAASMCVVGVLGAEEFNLLV